MELKPLPMSVISPKAKNMWSRSARTTSNLFGTIKDGTSGAALKRALVIVKGKWFLKIVLTDEKGFFEIDRLQNDGSYKICVLKQGYRAVLGNRFQFDGSPVEQNIYLQK